MSHWEHIGYIYQSRKRYRVNNISVWHLLHIQKWDPQIFSSQGHVVIIQKIKPWVYTAVTLCIYSQLTWPKRMHHHAPTTVSLQEADHGSPRTAAKKLCDFEEVAKLLWALVFSSDELDDLQGPSAIPFNCLKNTWHYKRQCWRKLCYKRWIKADVQYGRCYGWNVLVLRKLIKQRNNTVDSEETREVSEHLAKVTRRVGGQGKEGPDTPKFPT